MNCSKCDFESIYDIQDALCDWVFNKDGDTATTGRSGKPRSKLDSHPELLQIIDDFVSQHGAEAHKRRRDSTQYTNGASLQHMVNECVNQIPNFSISRSTVSRYFQPPNKKFKNHSRFSGRIDVKVPPKRNQASINQHPLSHYCRALVRNTLELGQMFSSEVALASLDNKDKFHVGTLAITRHQKIRRYFKKTDAPNYPDHDFPFSNSKLTPYGYQLLKVKPRRSRSLSRVPCTTAFKAKRSKSLPASKRDSSKIHQHFDKLGREHIFTPRTGKLDLFIAANRHFSSTSSAHCRHMREVLLPKWLTDEGILKQKLQKSVLIAVTDNGPDWNFDCIVNLMNIGQLWVDSSLDCLILVTYAPGDSRFNMIERLWSFINSCLTGVTLPITLPGDAQPPWLQNLPEKETKEKTDRVFWNANSEACKYLNGKKYDGFIVEPHAENFHGKEEAENHEKMKKMLTNISKTKLKEPAYKDLQEKYKFFVKHCVKRPHYLQFSKCKSCVFCQKNPIKATHFMKQLEMIGGYMHTPKESDVFKGHFQTFYEVLNSKVDRDSTLTKNLPSVPTKHFMQCEHKCNYVMSSYADAERHYKLMGHPGKPTIAKRKITKKNKVLKD